MDQEIARLLSRPTTSVDNAAKILGISRQGAYERVHSGDIDSISMGKRILVLTEPLKRRLGIGMAAA